RPAASQAASAGPHPLSAPGVYIRSPYHRNHRPESPDFAVNCKLTAGSLDDLEPSDVVVLERGTEARFGGIRARVPNFFQDSGSVRHRPGIAAERWFRDLLIGIMTEVIAGDAAEGRSNVGRQSITVGPRWFRKSHWHKKNIGRNQENGAFDEGDGSKP